MNRVKYETGYAPVPYCVMRDTSISIEARGLFALLATHSQDWNFYRQDIIKKCACSSDKYDRIRKELVSRGYLEIKPDFNKESGKIKGHVWILSDKKNQIPENPESGESQNQVKPESGSAGDISITKDKDIQNKGKQIESNNLSNINSIITHYNNTINIKSLHWKKSNSATKSKAISDRISSELKTFSLEYIINCIDILSESNYGCNVAGKQKGSNGKVYPNVTLNFVMSKLEKINSNGYPAKKSSFNDSFVKDSLSAADKAIFDKYWESKDFKKYIPAACMEKSYDESIKSAAAKIQDNPDTDMEDLMLATLSYYLQKSIVKKIAENNATKDANEGDYIMLVRNVIGKNVYEKFLGKENRINPKIKLPKGQVLSDTRFASMLRRFEEKGTWDSFTVGPEPNNERNRKFSKLTEQQYQEYLLVANKKC